MTIVPVNVDDITVAVKEMFTDHPDIGGAGVLVERYEEIRKEPTEKGWVCIYRTGVQYPARTLGMGSGYRNQRVGLTAICHESDPSSGEEAGQRLDDLLQKLIGALLSDPSLKGTVQTLDEEFSVQYFDYSKAGQTFVQFAQINFTGLIPVSAV